MSFVTGTPEQVQLDGVSYDVLADSNVTFMLTPHEVEGVPTSGATIKKMTRRSPNAEGLVLAAGVVEKEALIELSENKGPGFPISVTLANGDVVSTTGWIYFENWESEEGRATITVIPNVSRNAWTLLKSS